MGKIKPPDLCCHCNKRPAGPMEYITFRYQGATFEIPRWGSECTLCARKLAIERYHKYAEKIVQLGKKKEIKIDWQAWNQIRVGEFHGGQKDQILVVLVDLRLLIHHSQMEKKAGWSVMTTSLSLDPNPGIEPLYFARREDAEAYKNARYKNACYPVRIIHIIPS